MIKTLLTSALAGTSLYQTGFAQVELGSFSDKRNLVDRYVEMLEVQGADFEPNGFRAVGSPRNGSDDQLKDRLTHLLAVGIKTRFNTHGLPDQVAHGMARGLGGDMTFCDPTKGCTSAANLDGIWGYGCWCNFGSALLLGSAEPVNRFDAICKKMQLCLRCAKLDGEADGYECDPKTKTYNAAFAWGLPQNSELKAECEQMNTGDPCGTHACTCEVDMINSLVSTIWEMVVYEPKYKHTTFDHEANCPTNPDHSTKGCCGYYPDRSPYNLKNRQCCGQDQQLFNSMRSECCVPEGVFPVGTCPS